MAHVAAVTAEEHESHDRPSEEGGRWDPPHEYHRPTLLLGCSAAATATTALKVGKKKEGLPERWGEKQQEEEGDCWGEK